MHDSHDRLSSSKSLGQIPPVRSNHSQHHAQNHRDPPSTARLTSPHSHRSRDRVSISNLINAVDNTHITSGPSSPTLYTDPHQRSSSLTRNNNNHNDELSLRRKRIQSEKKRLWRKNLSPDQKAKRQELDAQRKREQRMNMTPDQRAEARRKDAARKAAKRRLQKEQQLHQQRDRSPGSSAMFAHGNLDRSRPTPLPNLPHSANVNVRPDLALSSQWLPMNRNRPGHWAILQMSQWNLLQSSELMVEVSDRQYSRYLQCSKRIMWFDDCTQTIQLYFNLSGMLD